MIAVTLLLTKFLEKSSRKTKIFLYSENQISIAEFTEKCQSPIDKSMSRFARNSPYLNQFFFSLRGWSARAILKASNWKGGISMINTTLCYIRRGGEYLMLHRIKKKNDLNQDKWIGIGGKFEDKESPEDCLLREAKEETGLTLTDWQYRGIVTFVSDCYPTEYMHLFTADGYTGELKECDEL